MDAMDFTMEDSSNLMATSSQRYNQCQQGQAQVQAHPHINTPNFTTTGPSQARENQHYDPVHESTTWYHQNLNASTNSHPPSYSATPHTVASSWSNPSPHIDPPTWSNFPDNTRHGRIQDYNSPEFRRAFMPWSEARSFEALGHAAYNQSVGSGSNNTSTEAQARSGNSLGNFGIGQPHQYSHHRSNARSTMSLQYTPANVPVPMQLPISLPLPSSTSSSESRPPQPSVNTAVPTVDPPSIQQPPSFTALRSGFTRSRTNPSRHEDILDGSRRRRLAATQWDSEDEEDSSLAEIERMALAHRHAAAELMFAGSMDDGDRAIAALRGAVAGGKRVPSKEALDSLETVQVKELTDADRTCIICYNEFGISNPEGDIENPIRLPKCKHIFGDKCIKKWFEDSDSCPYCRDKLPSELAVRKSLGAYQSYRLAQREQIRALTQRTRLAYTAGLPSGPGSSENNRSPQTPSEHYDYMMSRPPAESWGFSPPGRNGGGGESPERRRQTRGRHSAIRGPHLLGRPPSTVGSARPSGQSYAHHQYSSPRVFADYHPPPRRNATSEISAREDREARITAAEEARIAPIPSPLSPFQPSWGPSAEPATSTNQATRERLPPNASIPVEEASPPVAIGSGFPSRRGSEQQGPGTARLSLDSDSSDFLFDSPGPIHGRHADRVNGTQSSSSTSNEPPPGMQSFGPLEVRNNGASSFGSDSANDRHDNMPRFNRLAGGVPPNWQLH